MSSEGFCVPAVMRFTVTPVLLAVAGLPVVVAAALPALVLAFFPAAAVTQVVENPRPQLAGARAWRVEPVPVVHIGSSGGDNYEFHRIRGITRLSDGRIVVANGGTNSLRFFDSTGRFLVTSGRFGNGPGEFRQLSGVRAVAGDTLHVIGSNDLVSYISPSGRFIRYGARRGQAGPDGPAKFVYPNAVLPDGSHLGMDAIALAMRRGPQKPGVDSTTLYRISPDGMRADNIGRFPYREYAASSAAGGRLTVQLSNTFRYAGSHNVIFAGFSDRAEIGVFDFRGTHLRTITWAIQRQPVTPSLIAEYKQRFLTQPGEDGGPAPRSLREYWQRIVPQMVFPKELPAFRSLATDRDGNLWVERYDVSLDMPGPLMRVSPSEWDVFNQQGRWITTLQLPANFALREIGDRYVAGVWRDADDVEHVRLYRLIRP